MARINRGFKNRKSRWFDLDNKKRRGVQILRPESRPVDLCALPQSDINRRRVEPLRLLCVKGGAFVVFVDG
mgnify:CR=1 FL=1